MLMDKIYTGDFDPNMLRVSPQAVDQTRVDRIVERYREILKDYPPGELEAKGALPAGLLQSMREGGFFGLSIATSHGGQGLNLQEYLDVVEVMVKLDISIAITFLAHLSIGVKAVQIFGNEDQKQRFLPRAASGEMIFAYALTEPSVGSDAKHIKTTALAGSNGAHYLLNGQKTYITNANYAGGMTVFAQLDPTRPGFMGAFIVETGWKGVSVGKEMPKMGLSASSTAAVRFEDVRVPEENLIGRPGDGFKIAMTVLNYGRLALGAASTALMNVSTADMLKRASSRIQFRMPIKNFQLIQEKIARAEVNSAVSSAMTRFAAGILNDDPLHGAAIETSHCKLFGTTRAWDAVYDALQVAGGAGYLKTLPFEKRMRDFRVATVFEGTTEVHSIYPALLGMRAIEKWRRKTGRSSAALVFEMAKLITIGEKWPRRDLEDSAMRKVVAEAKKCAGAARILLIGGALLYGRQIAGGRTENREFLLRRITTLSLYTFGLLALLSEARQNRVLTARDRLIMKSFIEEAKEARKQNGRLFDSRRQRLDCALFRDLDGQGGPSRHGK
jgi:acyl-CoA dehydrogenase family protein 9